MQQNERLIIKIANKFYTDLSPSIDFDDLIQEGSIGLMLAAEKYIFGLESKAKFSTYAVHWIYQKMHRFIRYRNTNEETSLNKPYGEDNAELGEFIMDPKNDMCSIEDSVYLQELSEELRRVMTDSLTLTQREVLNFRYGLDCKPCTYEEVGEILGFTKVRAQQIEHKSLSLIRRTTWGRKRIAEHMREYGDHTFRSGSANAWDSYIMQRLKEENREEYIRLLMERLKSTDRALRDRAFML